ncbi:penicillin-binding protein [Rufibacter immobilis]|uniref:Penicillin-binding protein n=1 Tax=Rufibacter immobilis TaxID=1348778 RepID=A0A3M9N3Y7_9BACT|nr:transglycosylase domain-containing protein [Rufibacter immobilis]RNI32521.1 penicillin-binding protein [Rufibacter immobilis]
MSSTPDKKYRKIISALWLLFAGGFVFFLLYVFAVSINFLNLFGDLPDLKTLENPKSELASEVYSEDGQLLGKYFRENRSPVTYEQLPKTLVDALIATEDIRFEEHSGIDFKGTLAVPYYKLTGKQDRGSSTLTQQLARNLFRTRDDLNNGLLSDVPGLRMLIIKTKEWIMSVKLERSYTKKEILLMYLNTVDFGSNAYGIKVAAKTFFNKNPEQLTLEEGATLVGVLKGPSYYSPVTRPERSQNRRNTVLDQMLKYNYIDESAFKTASAKPIKLDFNVENQNKGLAPYFRTEIGKSLAQWCRENGYDLYSDGLKIYTTIDSRMQQHAEAALEQHMKVMQKEFFQQWKGRNPWIDENGKEIKNFLATQMKRTARYKSLVEQYGDNQDSINYHLNQKVPMRIFSWKGERDTLMSPMDSLRYYKHYLQAGFMAMDPLTGKVKAWVGGTNYKYFKYDHVKQGARQPGSTFKPFVYTAAIEAGYSPCYEVVDAPVTIINQDGVPWTPKNSDGKYTGRRHTLREALAFSVNTITTFLMKKLGPEAVVATAKRLGITTKLNPYASLALGSDDVTLYDMVGAYGTFVNKGVWTQPQYLLRIEDKNGNLLHEFVPKTVDAISEETAYLMVHMLQGSADIRGGTAYYGLRHRYGLKNEIGAKTGTTSNYSDAWFMGITPDLAAGVWVGGEDRSIHFRSAAYGQGNKLAMPIYALFMKKVYADKSLNVSKAPFPKPSQPLQVQINCGSYNNVPTVADSVKQDQTLTLPENVEEERF